MRKFALWFLKLYQRFFTVFSFGSCRYYPTCSEYAKLLFEYDNLVLAFMKSVLRILRCNQLFKGGIDYPAVGKNAFKKPPLLRQSFNNVNIVVWFVPTKKSSFYVIKSLRSLNKF
ncbi:MAG: membrane protein insertion efficiency factor YidD [Campylobacteraceae bacterium]|jgi:putative membrane protein insertion efficiency factor|nr:membrane protein insertion efficiency factor YidD [Campylobacteraceae bacterium]